MKSPNKLIVTKNNGRALQRHISNRPTATNTAWKIIELIKSLKNLGDPIHENNLA
jgi:hypothetical protein